MTGHTRWFPAVPNSLQEVRSFVRALADGAGLHGDDKRDVLVAVAEAVDNSVSNDCASIVGVTWEPHDQGVVVTIEDDGVFEPGADPKPLGMRLLFGVADEVEFRPGRPTWPGTVVRMLVRTWSRTEAPEISVSAGRPRILLVDGDRFSGHALASFLHAEGYDVTQVSSVAAAEAALSGLPQLAIVDLMTSHGRGGKLCEDIKRDTVIPVVALSVLVPARHSSDAFLLKPAHPLQVLTAVRSLLEPAEGQP
ncbi:hypothetical protein Lesp02_44780 [Lentzea sp. NBRC 105346]|uniref:ATP-binding protein n=1 Tax=Lentzea sp. NBRC 105346 TaxID=3032205 RepID=UPI0024A34DE9|nr:ATP-binding protein [Lentzea sp. NBRC 105346]GLZ32290.1 hypothetical protein Lesp02_44780 [Lentzea sp. NBRC 105346]